MSGKRYCAVLGELTFNTALHIGVGRGGVGTDSPLRRNNRGEIILPGTAMAGALRSLATRLAPYLSLPDGKRSTCLALEPKQPEDTQNSKTPQICGCPVCHLFGEIRPNENAAERLGGRASRLWVYDAAMRHATGTFVRDGVGIDRETGTAARAGRVKFDQEILPAGAVFAIRLELDDASEEDQMLLAATLAEWMAGRSWLGGGAGRGLGNATLTNVRYVKNSMADSKELLTFLKSTDPVSSAQEEPAWLASNLTQARARVDLGGKPFVETEFDLQFEGLFLTQDATAAGMLGFDHVSLIDGVPGFTPGLKPVLPGSGLRGALRSHAERIARTLASYQAMQKGKAEGAAQIFKNTCPACNPLQDNPKLPLARCSELNNLPPRTEPSDDQLCLGCRLFGSSQRGSRLRVMDAPISGEPIWKAVDFLAIDRFTGGSLEGAKFDAAALWKPTFRVRLFLEEPEDWELGWMALVLRDLFEGYIPIGFGAAKGFGHALGKNLTLRCGFLSDKDWGGLAREKELQGAAGFYRMAAFTHPDWQTGMTEVTNWTKRFLSELSGVKRRQEFLEPLQVDTYFDKLESLYPMDGKEDHHA